MRPLRHRRTHGVTRLTRLACRSQAFRCSPTSATLTHLQPQPSALTPHRTSFQAVHRYTAPSHLDQLKRRLQILRLLRLVVAVPSNPCPTLKHKRRNFRRLAKRNKMPWWGAWAAPARKMQSAAIATTTSLRAWSMVSTTIRTW